MSQALECNETQGTFGPDTVVEKERAAVTARRSTSREAFLAPSPTCYVKSVDRALKDRDQLLAKYFRAVDSHDISEVPQALADSPSRGAVFAPQLSI